MHRRPLAILALGTLALASIAPLSLAQSQGTDKQLPEFVAKLMPEVAEHAPQAQPGTPAPAAEQLPSLEQMRIWYAIQREKLGENNEEVRNIAMMIKALSPPTFSIDFPGGTVAEYLAAIRKAFPGANIVGSAGLEKYTIPPITLTHVTIHGALEPLEIIVKPPSANTPRVRVMIDNDVASVWLDSFIGPGQFVREHAPLQTLVWNSKVLTMRGTVTVPDITGAIDTALSVFTDPKPEVRIHEQTGILVVRGTEAQLDAAREVIDQLGKTPPSAESWAAQEIATRKRDLVEMQQRVRTIELSIANLEARRKSVQQGLESDQIDNDLMTQRRMLDESKAALRATQETIAKLEASSTAAP
jgi:hypothetical protein